MKLQSYHHRGGETPLIGLPIHEFLERVARRFPEEEAVVSLPQQQRLTYAQFFQRVDDLAKGLMALGIERGDRVGIWSPNNLEWILLQIASAKAGAILVNINPAYRSAELRHALSASRLQVLFLIPSFRKSHYADMVRELCPSVDFDGPETFGEAEFPQLRHLVIYDPDQAEDPMRPAPGFRLWPEIIAAGKAISDEALAERAETLESDDPINIQFTSGTTGFAKPVVLSHHNILNNAYFVAEVLRFTEQDRLCIPVPFYHCFGMVLANLACLTHGATIVIPAPHFNAQDTLAAVAAERCTALHGVPTMFVAQLECPEFASYDLSSLRTGIMAGAPCPPPLMRQVMEDMGCREILIAYGQTEASPVTHITHHDDSFERRCETVGTSLPHQEAKIVDPESGALCAIGQPGEICFRGYHVMRGYFQQPEATAKAIDAAGWLHSGDLGVMDADGYVRITGRLKDMIIRGGENIYPAEIEAYLVTHPKVAQVAVFGLPHEKWGEEVGAWIQLHEGETATPEEFQEFAVQGMAHFKKPTYVEIVDEFPLTVTGKIQKFRIRDLVAEQRRHQPV